MFDVILIGGGRAGKAVAEQCADKGLKVLVVDDRTGETDNSAIEWVLGRGSVAGPGMVVVLDPRSADERRLVQTKAVAIAVGAEALKTPAGRMLGIAKLGAELAGDQSSIITDAHGKTRAAGIFAVGSCAPNATIEIVESLQKFCTAETASVTEKQ